MKQAGKTLYQLKIHQSYKKKKFEQQTHGMHQSML